MTLFATCSSPLTALASNAGAWRGRGKGEGGKGKGEGQGLSRLGHKATGKHSQWLDTPSAADAVACIRCRGAAGTATKTESVPAWRTDQTPTASLSLGNTTLSRSDLRDAGVQRSEPDEQRL
eukprot:586964-Rhodomonas_salina.1